MKQAENYAQGIMKAVASGMAPRQAVARVKEMLEQQGSIALLPHIVRALRQLAVRSAQSQPELRIAREEDEEQALKGVASYLAADGITASDVRVVKDDTVIGGWVYRNGSTYVDTSHKKQLITLYQRITE